MADASCDGLGAELSSSAATSFSSFFASGGSLGGGARRSLPPRQLLLVLIRPLCLLQLRPRPLLELSTPEHLQIRGGRLPFFPVAARAEAVRSKRTTGTMQSSVARKRSRREPTTARDARCVAQNCWKPDIFACALRPSPSLKSAFRYQKGTHNVFEVNETGYDNCTMDGVAGNWTSGKDFIPLPEARRYYFICGNGFCLQGMKVAITVHPLPHNASSSNGSSGHGSTGAQAEDSAAVALRARSAAWLPVLAATAAAVAAFC